MEPFRQEISATEAERAALARRFDLVALDRLSATVELARRGEDMFLLRAAFAAEFVQNCVVTLDPVGGTVSEEFTLLYGPPEMEAQAGQTVEDEVAFEPLAGTAIDIGEAVAQQFSLALPPFPRSPGAAIDAEAPPADDSGPLAAALSRLADRRIEPPR
ncbi:MAG: YceD family protein [Alphaproteobacteria bacterium]